MELKCQCGSTDLESYAIDLEKDGKHSRLNESLVCLQCNTNIHATYRLTQITYSTTTTTFETVKEKEHGA